MNKTVVTGGKTAAVAEPAVAEIPRLSDQYFVRTREIVGRYGDCTVTYAVFLRRPIWRAIFRRSFHAAAYI